MKTMIAWILLSTPAMAATVLTATVMEGVTLDKVKAAAELMPIAKVTVDKVDYMIACKGADGIACQVADPAGTVIAASDKLRLCKSGDAIGLMSDAKGLAGYVIVIPKTAVAPSPDHKECAG